MKILLLSSTYESLTQRLHVELAQRGHEVVFDVISDSLQTLEIIKLQQPELIIYPTLDYDFPKENWHHYPSITFQIIDDAENRPSHLDWLIQQQKATFQIAAIQLSSDRNTVRVWAKSTISVRPTSKTSLYLLEVQDTTLKVTLATIARMQDSHFTPDSINVTSCSPMQQTDRRIDWEQDSTTTILAKIHAADGYPGVADTIRGMDYYIYGATQEDTLRGPAKALIAKRFGAVCRATCDGAIWLSHLEPKQNETDREHLKLPAAMVFRNKIQDLPESSVTIYETSTSTYQEIRYEEHNQIGYLHFNFYEGTLNTEQCLRLREAIVEVLARPTRILVLSGGESFWSHGMDLRVIDASSDPAEESWLNANAMNDLILSVITASQKLTIAAVHGSASASGIALAAACDKICARNGVLFNLNYKALGLFGSDYWTYLLPKRMGFDKTMELIENCHVLSTQEAKHLGLIDAIISDSLTAFDAKIKIMAEMLAQHTKYDILLKNKSQRRNHDEFRKPLRYYREEELRRMKEEFFEPNSLYHLIRKQLATIKYPPT